MDGLQRVSHVGSPGRATPSDGTGIARVERDCISPRDPCPDPSEARRTWAKCLVRPGVCTSPASHTLVLERRHGKRALAAGEYRFALFAEGADALAVVFAGAARVDG